MRVVISESEFFDEDSDFTGIVLFKDFLVYVVKGKYHREDGPAVVYWSRPKYYYYEDKYHRLGGPAEQYKFGEHYWIYGKQVTKEKHDFLYSVYLESKKDFEDLMKFEGLINETLFDNEL